MIDPNELPFVASTLSVKAEASVSVSENELNLPEGKSIAELLYEEKEKNNQKSAQTEEKGQSAQEG